MEINTEVEVLQTVRSCDLNTQSKRPGVTSSEPSLPQSDGVRSLAPVQISIASISSSEGAVANGERQDHQSPPGFYMSRCVNDSALLIPTAVVISNIPLDMEREEFRSVMEEMGLPRPSPFSYHLENGGFQGLAYGNFETQEDTASVIGKMNHMELKGQELQVEHETIFSVQKREKLEIHQSHKGRSEEVEEESSVEAKEPDDHSMSLERQVENGTKPSPTVQVKREDSITIEEPTQSIARRNTQTWSLEQLPSPERCYSAWKPAKEILGEEPETQLIDTEGKANHDKRKLDNSSIDTHSSLSPPSPTSPDDHLTPEELEFVKASERSGVQSVHMDLFTFDQPARNRIYNHFISTMGTLGTMCDGTQETLNSPTRSPEDFALLRTPTCHHSGRRWWTILIDDLACEECVAQLKMQRKKPIPVLRYRRIWRTIKDRIKKMCRCANNDRNFMCNHRDTNRVDRLFRMLGRRNTLRIINVELHTKRWASIDPDVLESAVDNLGFYVTNLRTLCIRFHFCAGVPVEPDLVKRIISSLTKLQSLLPWRQRLMVYGFEAHEECQIAWAKKSRE